MACRNLHLCRLTLHTSVERQHSSCRTVTVQQVQQRHMALKAKSFCIRLHSLRYGILVGQPTHSGTGVSAPGRQWRYITYMYIHIEHEQPRHYLRRFAGQGRDRGSGNDGHASSVTWQPRIHSRLVDPGLNIPTYHGPHEEKMRKTKPSSLKSGAWSLGPGPSHASL